MNLPPLLRDLESALTQPDLDAASIARAARAVLEYLADSRTTTPADLREVARRMTVCVFVNDAQTRLEEALPETLASIITDMATFLDDTLTTPALARNFDSDVAALLRRLNLYDQGGAA